MEEFKKAESSVCKIGDTIEIVDIGEKYTTYYKAYKAMKFNDAHNDDLNAEDADRGTVFDIRLHSLDGETIMLGLNMEDGSQCLIGDEGVELVESIKTK